MWTKVGLGIGTGRALKLRDGSGWVGRVKRNENLLRCAHHRGFSDRSWEDAAVKKGTDKVDKMMIRRQNWKYDFHMNPLEGKFTKVAVIGAGAVGAACASNLILLKVCSEVILVDIADDRCEGEVLDLEDAGFVSGARCVKGTFEEAGQADVIVMTAGVGQKPGETRIQLIGKNKTILRSIFASMEPINPDAIILLVSNPVDILTKIAQDLSTLKNHQIFGSGTFLDTQRFRIAVASKLQIAPSAVNAYVLGEHGDSQFAATCGATIGGVPITLFESLTPEFLAEAAEAAKNRAYEIIDKKGATYHGIAACVATMVDSILNNRKMVFPLSVRDKDANVCISLPTVLGRDGAERILPLELNEEEREKYDNSCRTMREVLDTCE